MTSQKEIQSLLADIDSVLPKADVRLPWSKPGDVAAQRRVLERVRSYLVSLQQQNFGVAPEMPPASFTPEPPEAPQQVVPAMTPEMNFLRANLLQPLQTELEALRHERETLVREIRQLEGTLAQLNSLSQGHTVQQQIISGLSQELINRCTESLRQQLGQILANWEARLLNNEAITEGIALTPSSTQSQVADGMQPVETSEQLRQMQAQSDRMLSTLDASQRAIFEALQRNLQSYHESLAHGLDKMHRLSVQGEMLFSSLVNRWTQQLEPEASTILSGSVQLPDGEQQASDTTSSTPPETQLSSDALRVTKPSSSEATTLERSLTPQPDPLGETQIPLQLPIESLSEQESSAEGDVQPASTKPLLSEQDSFPENLNSEDWEIVEGLDLEEFDDEADDQDEVETFIQLDIDAQASLSLFEQSNTSPQSDIQDLDSFLDLGNEHVPSLSPLAPQTGTGQAPEQNFSSESRRQEIDELYQTLFGTEPLVGQTSLSDSTASSELDTSEPTQAATNFPIPTDDQIINADAVTPLSSQIEELLFEGLADPADEATQTQPRIGTAQPVSQSWEDLLFKDAAAPLTLEADLAEVAHSSSQPANSLYNRESASEQEDIEIIGALTDLFEEMGLPPAPPTAITDSLVHTSNWQLPEYETSDTEPQPSLDEDNYIPASPEEDLLATHEIDSELEREIWLDQNTLRQLQQDFDIFGESIRPDVPRQKSSSSPDNEFELSALPPDIPQANQPLPGFLMSEELLAEDWEEFALNDLTEGDFTESSDSTTSVTPESVASDFDPDLFPSETLHLDQDNVVSSSAATPEEPTLPEDLFALEDETFVEMLWDEPVDSTTTEEMLTSANSEYDWDLSLEETFNSEQEATLEDLEDFQEAKPNDLEDSTHNTNLSQEALVDESDDIPEAVPYLEHEESLSVKAVAPEEVAMPEWLLLGDDEGLETTGQSETQPGTQDTELPPQTLDNPSDSLSQEVLDLEQDGDWANSMGASGANALDKEALPEDEPTESLLQEIEMLDEADLNVDLFKSEALNPEQPDNENKDIHN